MHEGKNSARKPRQGEQLGQHQSAEQYRIKRNRSIGRVDDHRAQHFPREPPVERCHQYGKPCAHARRLGRGEEFGVKTADDQAEQQHEGPDARQGQNPIAPRRTIPLRRMLGMTRGDKSDRKHIERKPK